MQRRRTLAMASVCLAAGFTLSTGLARLCHADVETETSDGAIQIDAKEVMKAFETGGVLLTTGEYKVMAGHRDKGGVPEVHDADTDVFYILDGEATFITGGKVIEPKTESPGETLGTRIEGGTSRKLVKGDVIVIPRGLPHWFSEVPEMVNYFVVKVTAAKTSE